MKDANNEKIELIKTVYEQHWLHARHVENERLWFTNIFAIIFAGSLAVTKDKLFEISSLPLVIFLMILSCFGIMFSLKIDSIFKTHTEYAKQILKTHGLYDMWARYNKHWVNEKIRISRLFPIFFAICFYFFLFNLIYIFLKILLLSFIIPATLLVVTCYSLYRLKYDQFVEYS